MKIGDKLKKALDANRAYQADILMMEDIIMEQLDEMPTEVSLRILHNLIEDEERMLSASEDEDRLRRPALNEIGVK